MQPELYFLSRTLLSREAGFLLDLANNDNSAYIHKLGVVTPAAAGSEEKKHTYKGKVLMTIMYGIPNCDTIKKARKWLEAEGVDYQ